MGKLTISTGPFSIANVKLPEGTQSGFDGFLMFIDVDVMVKFLMYIVDVMGEKNNEINIDLMDDLMFLLVTL